MTDLGQFEVRRDWEGKTEKRIFTASITFEGISNLHVFNENRII
jgi:hypothetical protein